MRKKHLGLMLGAAIVFAAAPARAEHEGMVQSAWQVLIIAGFVALLIGAGLATASPRMFWIGMPIVAILVGALAGSCSTTTCSCARCAIPSILAAARC